MKTILLSVAFLFFFTLIGVSSFCQKKRDPLGVISYRCGLQSSGVSAGISLKKNSSLMLLYTEGSEGRNTGTMLYMENFKLGNARGLNWFAGAGLHIGSRKISGFNDPDLWVYNNRSEIPRERAFVLGASTMIGLSYQFCALPLRLSLDVKPFVDFVNGQSGLRDLGLSAGISF